MVITSKQIPQLFAYEDEEAKRILRNLKKVEIKNEYKIIDNGVREYVSVPKLDQKAFRYLEKNGKLYLRESVTSVGGLVQDSVLINLGDFTIGDDEVGEELEYLVRVKDAKAKQRARQLQECERIAQQFIQKIQKQVKNDELLKKWQNELNESKRFVRFGKEDYYQSQVAIIAKFAKEDETLAKLMVDYDQKMNDKNEKWLTQPLKLPKVKNASERIGTKMHEGIGEPDPQRRAEFEKYYEVRSPQMTPYLTSENEVAQELAPAPTIIADKEKVVESKLTTQQVTKQSALQQTAQQKVQVELAPQMETTKPKVKTVANGITQMKQAFRRLQPITTETTEEVVATPQAPNNEVEMSL